MNSREPTTVTSPNAHLESTASGNRAYVMLANISCEILTIPKSTVLGVAEDVSEALIDKINSGKILMRKTQSNPVGRGRVKPSMTSFCAES
jgi:hypothetical protein